MKNTSDFPLLPGERLDKINERISLIQKCDGLTFGTDAYLLAAFVSAGGGKAADLGAGTGAASLLCAARGKADRIYASEIQPEFAELCRRNAVLNGLPDRVISICRDVRDLTAGDMEGEVDFVISNPPYMRADSGRGNASDAKNIARREIYGSISDFCGAAARILKYGGDFYTVYRPDRLCELIAALREQSLEPKLLVTVYPREDSAPCLVLIKSRKGGKAGLSVSPPLIIYRKPGIPASFSPPDGGKDLGYTEAFSKVYENFSLSHLFQR